MTAHGRGGLTSVVLQRILRAGEGRTLKRLTKVAAAVDEAGGRRRGPDRRRAARADRPLSAERLADGETRRRPAARGLRRRRGRRRRRVLGQRHFDVQVLGGAALHLGNIAEMRTGEGKTLTCVLPAYLNGLTGRGVHVVTVNDYLARRDAEWMGRVHRFARARGGRRQPADGARRRGGPPTPPTSPTGRTTSSASTTCATTWPPRPRRWSSAATTSPSSTRWTRSSSTRRAPP